MYGLCSDIGNLGATEQPNIEDRRLDRVCNLVNDRFDPLDRWKNVK